MTLCSCLPVSAPTNFSDMRIWCCYWTRFLSFSYILKKKKLMYIFSLSFYIDWRSETKVGCGDTNSKIVCVCCIFFLWQIVDVLTFLWPRSLENSITSFGDRSNDFETASDYFKSHFIQVHRRKDVSNRSLYVVSLPFFFSKIKSNNLIILLPPPLYKKHFTSMLVR